MNEFDLRSYLYNNPLMEKKEDSKKGNKEMQKRMKGAIEDNEDHIEKLKGDIKADKKKLAKLKKDFKDDVNEGMDKEDKKLTKEGLKSMIRERITSILNEETIDEGDDYYEDVTEQEEDEVDVDVQNKVDVKDKEEVDVDVEKEKEVDDVSKETDIDVKTSLPGESEDVDAVLGLLTKASEEADRFSDDPELKTQIGNTITYFTRKHVAKT